MAKRGELKHLSTLRNRKIIDSVSSGERKRNSLNLRDAKLRGVVFWVLWGSAVPTRIGTERNLVQLQQNGLERPIQEGDSPVSESVEHFPVGYPKYPALSGTAGESGRTTS